MKLQQRNDGKFLLVLTDKERTNLLHALFDAANMLPELNGNPNYARDKDLLARAKNAAAILTKTLHIVQAKPT